MFQIVCAESDAMRSSEESRYSTVRIARLRAVPSWQVVGNEGFTTPADEGRRGRQEESALEDYSECPAPRKLRFGNR